MTSPRPPLAALAALALALLNGCTSPLQVTSSPPGASVSVNNQSLGVTPTQLTLEGNKPVAVEFRLEGYFPEAFEYLPNPDQHVLTARLEPKSLSKTYAISSDPDGATLTLEGQPAGTTPASALAVTYTRPDKASAWTAQSLLVSKPNYQSETVRLEADTATVPTVALSLLREERVYTITAATAEGAELNAEVTLNGAAVGATPLKLPLTFQRPNKGAPWPRFNLTVAVPAKYQPVSAVLDFGHRELGLALTLQPITEITTELLCPALVMTPTGVVFKIQPTRALGLLSTRESAEIVTDLKPVTNFGRRDQKEAAATRAESLNSFCVTPDGQHIIFGLTEHDEQGNLYSNLFIKQADDAASGVARLTQGSRYLDTLPDIANDGSNYLVFASNRSDRNKPDIFRVNFVDNRLAGGISRLTNDARFNFAPTYGDSNRQLFYLSTEPNFPLAESQVSNIRFDGSLPTQLPIAASEINNTFAEKVFFVKLDADTRQKQIYSITADGKLETALISQEDFRKSNCFNPAVSPDGTRVLFVSDHGVDELGRHNNDIYLINADGTNLLRLTQNGSDDLLPAWSPTEDGVIFFLSNRGGAYNVWRLKLSSGSKGAK
jgi:hypothetical protein